MSVRDLDRIYLGFVLAVSKIVLDICLLYWQVLSCLSLGGSMVHMKGAWRTLLAQLRGQIQPNYCSYSLPVTFGAGRAERKLSR